MPTILPELRSRTHQLSLLERLAYSVGHFYNDLCAAMWFSYLLVFFHYLLGFENRIAGFILLLGQVVDAVSTPLIGIESDRTAGFCRYGKRKSWHLIGTIFVTLSFPFIFLKCIFCSEAPHWYQFVYFAPFVALFQFGWASVQIAHMSIVNSLTTDESERVELYSWRNANTLVASIVVYGIAWGLLGQDDQTKLGAQDIPKFMILMFIVVGVGLLFSLVYHLCVREDREPVSSSINSAEASIEGPAPDSRGEELQKDSDHNIMRWKDWLKEYQFYLVAGQYMLARLIFNVTQTYWPYYITETARLEKKFTAIIPMVICVAGFVSSLGMRFVNKLVGRKSTFALGLAITVGSLIWLYFIPQQSMMVFGPALVIGVGSNTLIVSSLSMAADIIGNNVRSSAFVYGAMSFTDKLSSGVAVVLVQHYVPDCSCPPSGTELCCTLRADYFRHIMAFLPIACVVLCVAVLLIMIPMRLGRLRKYVEWQGSVNRGSSTKGAIDHADDDDAAIDERSRLLRVNSAAHTSGSVAAAEARTEARHRGYGSGDSDPSRIKVDVENVDNRIVAVPTSGVEISA